MNKWMPFALATCLAFQGCEFESGINPEDFNKPYDPKPDETVTINGVTWATRNVDVKGRFVDNQEDFGGYFTIDEAQTACPSGWNLPLPREITLLHAAGCEWTNLNGTSGLQFGRGNYSIFLPAAGYRTSTYNQTNYLGWRGCYYFTTGLYFIDDEHLFSEINNGDFKNYYYSVRCVHVKSEDVLRKIYDTNFLAYCESQMTDWDLNRDGKLSPEEASSVTKINIEGGYESKEICSLVGIEYFTGLIELNCSNNRLTSLDISKNTKLRFFYCYGNKENGTTFPVKAWFDNDSIPTGCEFTKGWWSLLYDYIITVDYWKAN